MVNGDSSASVLDISGVAQGLPLPGFIIISLTICIRSSQVNFPSAIAVTGSLRLKMPTYTHLANATNTMKGSQ